MECIPCNRMQCGCCLMLLPQGLKRLREEALRHQVGGSCWPRGWALVHEPTHSMTPTGARLSVHLTARGAEAPPVVEARIARRIPPGCGAEDGAEHPAALDDCADAGPLHAREPEGGCRGCGAAAGAAGWCRVVERVLYSRAARSSLILAIAPGE